MADAFVIARTDGGDSYTLWSWDPCSSAGPLKAVTSVSADARLPAATRMTSVGRFLLLYSPPKAVTLGENAYVDFTLLDFDPTLPDPLSSPVVQQGSWCWDKFTGDYSFTAVPGGPQLSDLRLTGVTGYLLSTLPTPGRSTFTLWNFDANLDAPGGSEDPIRDSMSASNAFPQVGPQDQLVPIGNCVLVVNRKLGTWRVFSFDPQLANPLSAPELAQGALPPGLGSELVAVDGHLLAWSPGDAACQVHPFVPTDPFAKSRPFPLPAGFPTAAGTTLTAVQVLTRIQEKQASTPGSMDFMRSRIKHVVTCVLESRSFDSVLGWLYDPATSKGINWVPARPGLQFEGACASNTNRDSSGAVWHQKQVNGGAVSTDLNLDTPVLDPFHGTSDSIHQQWTGGYADYRSGVRADMGGFVLNNGNAEVMEGYSPEQLAVLNGLAFQYAVSDAWFCSEAGGTTTNRATLTTGSAFNITVTYEGGAAYEYFPKTPHRQSLWKVLANHGIMDWAIYYSVLWENEPYTYHLALEGQLPSVDAAWPQYVQPIDGFFLAAAKGELPAFSFLEPVWYDPSGVFTSYHPTGDVLPGEQGLLNIFNALRDSPAWDETALVISFSKGGGMYDHVPAHPMVKAWPNDGVDGYEFDTTGARVPTIVVSPLVKPNTVFRSEVDGTPYDATSLAATVLSWFGVPRSKWGMGERVAAAPTFEGVFQRKTPRTDAPSLAVAVDKTYPTGEAIDVAAPTPVSSVWGATSGSGAWTDDKSWGDGALPTDQASFGPCDLATVSFASSDPQSVNEVVFEEGAPAYTLLFEEATPEAPTLTIAGAGVRNASGKPQTFRVTATSVSTSQVQLAFLNEACAGDSSITYVAAPASEATQSGGIIAFNQRSNAGSASFEVSVGALPPGPYSTVGAEVRFLHHSSAAQATFTVTGTTGTDPDTFGNVVFHHHAKAAAATFTNVGGAVGDGGNTQFFEQTSAEAARITNQGATGDDGNGGDTAFDGTATAAEATITNTPATAGHGGVVSFNNNPPYMAPGFGASAGRATIVNQGAPTAPSGSGGHTNFPGSYGSGSGGHATIDNLGTGTANSTGGGYTVFSVSGRWPYQRPTAGHATITNHPGACAGAQPGETRFEYLNYDDDGDEDAAGPTAGHATITSLGGAADGAPGGNTSFSDQATAGRATLIATGGTDGGSPGTLVFSGQADGDQATVQLRGGSLDVAASIRASLAFGSLEIQAGSTLAFQAGGEAAALVVKNELRLAGPITVGFDAGDATDLPPQRLLASNGLQKGDASKFVGLPVNGRQPEFEVRGEELWVTFVAGPA